VFEVLSAEVVKLYAPIDELKKGVDAAALGKRIDGGSAPVKAFKALKGQVDVS
jgi:hypothetical protein